MRREVIDARPYRLRHVAPDPSGAVTILGRTYSATKLPARGLPSAPDLVEGQHTRRLGDAGQFTLEFPNRAGSDGVQWRTRFDPDLSLEWIEVYRDDELEFVGSIQKLDPIDRGRVVVSGPDAMDLLRRAYERNRTWTEAPRDVIEHYTRVPRMVIAEDFADLSAWTPAPGASASGGILRISCPGASYRGIKYASQVPVSDSWRAVAVLQSITSLQPSVSVSYDVGLKLAGPNPNTLEVSLDVTQKSEAYRIANPNTFANIVQLVTLSQGGVAFKLPNEGVTLPATLEIECQGRWLSGYCNGQLVAMSQTPQGFTSVQPELFISSNTAGSVDCAWASLTVRSLADFLNRGADKGDYSLPGDYPSGGVRAKVYNNLDLYSLSSPVRLERIHAPNREPYAEKRYSQVSGPAPVRPGSNGELWSIRFQGAIYLRLSLGNYTFRITSLDDSARLWIGKTAWGTQILDSWIDAASRTIGPVTLLASSLGARDGWYSLICEYQYSVGGVANMNLEFQPPSAYTDPGGTSITAINQSVPLTSLSPLGVYDEQLQATSHFDAVQQVAEAFGYQMMIEPRSLESGAFPGILVPRVRVGRDTDVVLSVEDDGQGEPLLSPSVAIDAGDQVTSMRGNGAGPADGKGSQLQGEVVDIAGAAKALFALEGWVDRTDVSLGPLLDAHLNAQLALRASAWQEVKGNPRALDQLAAAWPLSPILTRMRWEPGYGVRLWLPDLGLADASPRPLTQVTRRFVEDGRTGTDVDFRQRPRGPARSVRRGLRSAVVSQRNYQRQKLLLNSDFGIASINVGGITTLVLALLPQDTVIRAYVRIVLNSPTTPTALLVNGVNYSPQLGGPWSGVPVEVDFTAYANQSSVTDPRLYVQLRNESTTIGTNLQWQFFVEVLR